MNESDCERIDIALSGGGTRAALYSGGALIAVQEAVLAGKVEVGAIHAVSGSSLLLARIILASDDRERNGDLESDLQLVKDEVEAIARYGFAPSPVIGAAVSLGFGVIAIGVFWVASLLADPPFRVFGVRGVFFALVVGAVFYQWMRRGLPFNLRRVRRVSFGGTRRAQHAWFAQHNASRRSALPSRQIGFVCTSLKENRAVLLDPWESYDAGGRQRSRLSLAECVGASAAVPLYSAPVRLENDLLVDGGVIDNLGVTDFIQPGPNVRHRSREKGMFVKGQKPARIVAVDSSVPKRLDTRFRDPTDWWIEILELMMPTGLMASVVFLVVVIQQMGWMDRGGRMAEIVGLCFVLAGLHFVFGSVARQALGPWRSIRAETGATDAIMEASRNRAIATLEESDRNPALITLRGAPAFSDFAKRHHHDLRTRLSAVRRDTAIELVRVSYAQTANALGTRQRPLTQDWLNGLAEEFAPTKWNIVGRRIKQCFWWVGAALVFGWRHDSHWYETNHRSTEEGECLETYGRAGANSARRRGIH